MLMNACETFVADRIREKFPGRHLTIAPSAILTKALPGRARVTTAGPCERGCSTGSYFSSISSTLPAARATGNLTVVTDSVVVGLDFDPKSRKVSGVSRHRSEHPRRQALHRENRLPQCVYSGHDADPAQFNE
jgi:choline dehydrogenase-like flavoprotein